MNGTGSLIHDGKSVSEGILIPIPNKIWDNSEDGDEEEGKPAPPAKNVIFKKL